jgi:FxsC-like protein
VTAEYPPSADEAPYFFLSYAHTPQHDPSGRDLNEGVIRLYNELCEHILALTALPVGARVGFMDHELRPGNVWPWELSYALATCHVFVPLYSARFFASAQCGKEWWAFSLRMAHQAARAARPVEAIVPVIWTPVGLSGLPEAAKMIQFDHRELGHLYAAEGLYGLSQLDGDTTYRAAYKKAVFGLAKRIVDVAERVRIEPGQPSNYEALDSAFGSVRDTAPGDRRLRITIVAPPKDELPASRGSAPYGRNARDWNPYYPECRRPLAEHASDLVRNLGYRPVVSDLDERGEVSGPGDDRSPEPEILLVDPWATAQAECRLALARFNNADEPWIQVVIPLNLDDDESARARNMLWECVEASLGHKLAQGRAARGRAQRGTQSLEDFSLLLPRAVAEAFRHYLKHAQAYPPDGPAVKKPRLIGSAQDRAEAPGQRGTEADPSPADPGARS